MKKLGLPVLALLIAALVAMTALAGCAPQNVATPDAPADTSSASPSAPDTPADTASASPSAPDAAADDSLQKVQDKGEIVMGLDDSFPPMGFRDESGNLVGFDIDLATAVVDNMGLKVKLQPIDWTTKELELNNGSIDMIWNGYTITEERKEQVLMSKPYMANKQVVVVKTDSPVNALSDLSGKKVAVQSESSAQEAIEANPEFAASITQVDFKDNVTAMNDVAIGATDALAVDLVVAEYYMAQKPGEFRMLEETLAPEEYGIGFRKADKALHDAVMASYDELKASGKTAEISTKWFGKDVTY